MANYFLGNAINVACENYYDLFSAAPLCEMSQCAYTFPAGSTSPFATPATYDYLGDTFTIIDGTAAPDGCSSWSYAPNVNSSDVIRSFAMFVNYGTTIGITFDGSLSEIPNCSNLGTLRIRGLAPSNLGTLSGPWYYNNTVSGNCSNYISTSTPVTGPFSPLDHYALLNTKSVLASTGLSDYCCPSGWAGPYSGSPVYCTSGAASQDAFLTWEFASMVSSYEYTCDNPCGVRIEFSYAGAVNSPGTISFPGGAGGNLSFYVTLISKACPPIA